MVDTKLEAYKLVHDPARLLNLLYSKYIDIKEDYALLYTNQIIYDRKSHFNICYKEQKVYNDIEEYLRRIYKKKESRIRILKLNEYYKNYQSFFCKATFTDFILGNILKNYQDTKAEIFYKKNYGDSSTNKVENEKSVNYNASPSLSSLDNITYNKTIFDKKNKQIIDNDDKNFTITLTSANSFGKFEHRMGGQDNLLSTSNLEDSFIKCVKNIVNYKKKKRSEIRDKKEINKENDLSNMHKKVNEKIKRKMEHNHEKILLEKSSKENSNNSKNLFSLLNFGNSIKLKSNKNIKNISHENKISSKTIDLFLSSRTKNIHNFINITSRINQLKKNMPINIKYLNKNKSSNNNDKNNSIGYNSSNQGNNELNFIKRRNNSKIRISRKNNSKNYNSRFKQYNQFLILNKNNKNNPNLKNKTDELINRGNKIHNSTSQNLIFNHYEKIKQSSTIYKNELRINGTGSKYRLFKRVNFSPESIFYNHEKKNVNRNLKKNRKYFPSSNSLDNNNPHKISISPKFILSNLNINSEKIRHIGMNKMNKVGNNTCIQNNINIINKIKIQPKHNKRNDNFNINFNNLIFCGGKIPTSYFENFRNNIINNQNRNLNTNKINTNFYMLSFNNYNSNIIENKTNYKNFKKHELLLNLNPNKIRHLTKNKISKFKNMTRKKSNKKIRNIKLELNNNNNNL